MRFLPTIRLFLGAIMACLSLLAVNAQPMRIATHNLRYDNPDDSLDLWRNRCPVIADLVQFYGFEIFGTQEGLFHQLTDLKKALPGYDFIGAGRDDGKQGGEHSAIFYKTSQFKVIAKGDFWLSAVTNKPNTGWDAALPRICSWGKFEEMATGKTFFMFNAHFDHRGKLARMESARLVVAKVREIAGTMPAILSGDFNFDETNPNFSIINESGILKDSYGLATVRFAPGGTFNDFDVTSKPHGRIDHLFLTSHFSVTRYGILTNTYNGRYPSDHFPVLIEVELKK